MGKLYDRLQKQLTTEHKKDAEDCMKIYNHLIQTTGHVWESAWRVMVNVKFIGPYPYTKQFKPSVIGYTYISGIEQSAINTADKEPVINSQIL